MLADKFFEVATMLISFFLSIVGYWLIARKDRSWINWATPSFFLSVGTRYFFQFGYLLLVGAGGSHFAYVFCYATYALSSLSMALAYAFLKPVKWRLSRSPQLAITWLPWILVIVGVLLYLPVLIEFRDELANPRRIYELTRSGYGVWTYGSATFVSLGFVIFLFKKNRTVVESCVFYAICGASIYWHGSKGGLLTFALIYLMYRVYILQKRTRAFASITLLGITASLLIILFAVFGNAADSVELFQSVISYADYVRNAMLVIDDTHGRRYYGQLSLESEIYARIPRIVDPDKPKDFGSFALAKIYTPESYRNDEGTAAFDIGVSYADFGTLSILFTCAFSALVGWLAASATKILRRKPSIGAFVVLLYFGGISLIPISGAFFLPETLILTWLISLALRINIFSIGKSRSGLINV